MTSELSYPLASAPAIGGGAALEVAPGVFWLRMPVGGRLEAVNVWALADDDGWTIVDTGLRTPESIAAWRVAFDGVLEGRPIRRVVLTHLHPDHSGLAGWLVRKHSAALWMSRLEYLMLRVLVGYTGQEAPAEAVRFYRQAGWTEEALDRYRARFGEFGKNVYALPDAFHAIADLDEVSIGGRPWEVVVGNGHSPEHAMLYCRKTKVLISGDQVLPQISSNVSVHPLEPDADPLTDWLRSLERIRLRVPEDVLVLPSHGAPFHGLHARIDRLMNGHEEGLRRLAALLETPRRAVDVFPALFKRQVDEKVLGLATGESLAHLACLVTRGEALSTLDEQGVRWWRAR